MRSIKILLAMSLLVFLFSGCGGSSGGDSDDTDASTLHTTIVSTLEGNWFFDKNSEVPGTATNTANESISLYSVKNFKISVSDIVFDDTTIDSEASATVFYSYTSSARYANTTVELGNFIVKSYSDNSTTGTQEMILTVASNDQWVLSSPSSNIPKIIITRSTSRKINVQMTGTMNFSAISDTCDYTITGSMIKTSDTPTTDDTDEDSGGSTTESSIAKILTGTWKFSTGDDSTASATSDTQGTEKILTLRLASDVYMILSSVDLEPENNTTSLTGTVQVKYEQRWTAYEEGSEVMLGTPGAFALSKDEKMKLVKVSDGEWRIEDTKNSNENIVVTVGSSNDEISTVWTGTTTNDDSFVFDGDDYTYEITCSFRKQ